MKRREILDVLKKAGEPVSIEKLSDKTDESISSLRIDLFRMQEEDQIESVEDSGELKWKLKVSNPLEEKYEKMSKNTNSDQ